MDRVYVILEIMEGKRSEAVQRLQANPSVRWVDELEGQWDVITIIEASNRMRLAKHLVRALATVEAITEDLQVLPRSTRYVSSVKSTVKPLRGVRINKLRSPEQAGCMRDNLNIPGSV